MIEDIPEFHDDEPATSPSSSTAAPDVPQPGLPADDSFETALAQYNAEVPPVEAEADEPQDLAAYLAAAREQGLTDAEAMSLAPEEFKNQTELNAARDSLTMMHQRAAMHNQAIAAALRQERDSQDFRNVVRHVQLGMADILGDLPTDSVQALLLGAAKVDPRIAEAWDRRYSSPTLWQNRLTGLMHKVRTDLARRPDPDATETRQVVTASIMRGARGDNPREPQPLDLNRLSDREFVQHLETEYGIKDTHGLWG